MAKLLGTAPVSEAARWGSRLGHLRRVSPDERAVPHSDAVAADLLTALQALPAFDNTAVAEAMGSTTEAMFVCWQGEATGR